MFWVNTYDNDISSPKVNTQMLKNKNAFIVRGETIPICLLCMQQPNKRGSFDLTPEAIKIWNPFLLTFVCLGFNKLVL